jgi:hypothetical protein
LVDPITPLTGVVRILVGEDGVEPGHSFLDAAPLLPELLQRRRKLQRERDIRG